MFQIFKKSAPVTPKETASGFRHEFYTQNGWAGSRYTTSLSLKEIAKIVRDYVKNVYPNWRFSVTTHYAANCQELYVAVTEVPVDIFDDEKIRERAENAAHRYNSRETAEENYQMYRKMAATHIQNWELHPWFTEYGQTVLDDVHALVQSYNFSDCDPQIDYFHVNFYDRFDIGKWDKPVKIVPRIARIVSAKADNTVKRLAI